MLFINPVQIFIQTFHNRSFHESERQYKTVVVTEATVQGSTFQPMVTHHIRYDLAVKSYATQPPIYFICEVGLICF